MLNIALRFVRFRVFWQMNLGCFRHFFLQFVVSVLIYNRVYGGWSVLQRAFFGEIETNNRCQFFLGGALQKNGRFLVFMQKK